MKVWSRNRRKLRAPFFVPKHGSPPSPRKGGKIKTKQGRNEWGKKEKDRGADRKNRNPGRTKRAGPREGMGSKVGWYLWRGLLSGKARISPYSATDPRRKKCPPRLNIGNKPRDSSRDITREMVGKGIENFRVGKPR